MKDLQPELLKKIKNDFDKKVKKDSSVKEFAKKMKAKKATQEECSLYARRLGEILSDVLVTDMNKDVMPDGVMLWNIVSRTVEPMMKNNHELVSIASERIQNLLYVDSGIGIKAVRAEYNAERTRQIMNAACQKGITFEEAQSKLKEPIANATQAMYDDFQKENIEFAYTSGLSNSINRTVVGKCCKWCENLAGSYMYPFDVPDDIYRRHDNCKCTISHIVGKNKREIKNYKKKS